MLSVKNLTKSYQTTKSKTKDRFLALKGISIDFPETGFVFLLGKSGSGKSTLLNCIGGLDSFDSGEIIIKGKSSKDFTQSDFDSYRNTFIGFIFQEYNILENFTVAKNLALAIELQGKKAEKEEVEKLLNQVDMLDYAKRKPNQLSGGQKQRVAIARALIKNPEIIMADEPTGALDSNTGKQVMDTLKELSKTKLVIVVSHDRDFAEKYGDRIIELKDGNIISDTTKTEIESQKTQSGVSIIPDKYIHIQKGQELTTKDIQAIALMIFNNSKNSDTIISLDGKANKEIEKSQGITKDGNQITFVDTKPDDINIKKHNPKDLKLIRSHLKFKDSFKMGASALKSKVWKLVFTILLSFIAFTMFGVIDALSCWNRADSVYNSTQITNQKYATLKKEKLGIYGAEDDVMTDNDLKYLSDNNGDYHFKPILQPSMSNFRFKDYSLSNYTSSDSLYGYFASDDEDTQESKNLAYNNKSEGVINLTEQDLQYFGLTIEGRLPENSSEIAISKYFYEAIKQAEKNINSYSDITAKYQQSSNNTIIEFTVVGVVDDKVDLSSYANISRSDFQQRKLMKEVYAKTVGGFSRLLFVDKTFFDYLKENTGSNYNRNSYYYEVTSSNSTIAKERYGGNSLSNDKVKGLSNIISSSETLIDQIKAYNQAKKTYNEALQKYNSDPKNNPYPQQIYFSDFFNSNDLYNTTFIGYVNKSTAEYINIYDYNSTFVDPTTFTLNDDEVIISMYDFRKWANSSHSGTTTMNYEDIINLLNSDEKVTIEVYQQGEYNSDDRAYEHINSKTYTVVGFINNSNSTIITNDTLHSEFVNILFPGYSGTITKLHNNSHDKTLINSVEKYNSDNIKYPIQNSSTYLLDTFENTITELTKYLLYVAIAFAFFASLLLMNFISNSISYKKREIGVLRALGARGTDIFGIFFNESAIIAFINFLIASIATIIVCFVINSVMVTKLGISITFFNPSIRQIALILGISLLSAFIASIIPVSRFSHKKPIDAINNR